MLVRYINTDLDLVASADLTPLASALTAAGLFPLNVLDLGDGTWRANFETESQFEEPEDNIAALLSAIEALDPKAAVAWKDCTVREFSIGYQVRVRP